MDIKTLKDIHFEVWEVLVEERANFNNQITDGEEYSLSKGWVEALEFVCEKLNNHTKLQDD